MKWLLFGLGLMLGGLLGVTVMCLCFVSGEASRREAALLKNQETNTENTNIN